MQEQLVTELQEHGRLSDDLNENSGPWLGLHELGGTTR